jgi:hypothetical protein
MKLLGIDDWSRPVYKCLETDNLYKDINLGDGNPSLYSCGNDFDGESDCPINPALDIHFNKTEDQVTKEQRFNYQMLGRLKSDCDYYLGFGNHSKERLYYHDEQEHINQMKNLYNSFSEDGKPQWLTWEQILKYEGLMLKGIN